MTFTLAHGFAASIALHGALLLPLVVHMEEEPPPEPAVLVVQLQGLLSDTQSEQQVQQQSKGAPEQKAQDEAQEEQKTQVAQAAAPDRPEEQQVPDGTLAPAPPPSPEQKAEDAPPQQAAKPTEAQSGTPGLADVQGAREQKLAQRLEESDEALKFSYAMKLSKKVRENPVYPPNAQRTITRKGTAKVAFAVEADGRLREGSLKIERSSGYPAYDAAAMRTVEKNAPFDPPPKSMSLAVEVDYYPK